MLLSTTPGLAPGSIPTTNLTPKPSDKQLEHSLAKCPIGRMGKPEEIAYMALFLASSMSRFITGAIIPVDAGQNVGNYLELEWENPDPRNL